jgi:uncharacterized protein YoxC
MAQSTSATKQFDQYHSLITRELDKTAAATEKLRMEIESVKQDTALVIAELKHLKEDMQQLLRIVRDGNGKTTVLSRIADLDQAVCGLTEWRERELRRVEAKRTEMIRGRWQFLATAVAAVLALLGSALALVLR